MREKIEPQVKEEKKPTPEPIADEFVPPDIAPPPPEYVAPPPRDYAAPPPDFEPPLDIAPKAPVRGERGRAARVSASAPSDIAVTAADEGEFRHLSAERENGLEFMGKIVRALRKSDKPAAARVLRLLSRGVTVKERDDYVAFIADSDVFLQLGDESVKSVLTDVLASLGIKKSMRAEKTAGDMFREDVEKAKILFGRDGVTVK